MAVVASDISTVNETTAGRQINPQVAGTPGGGWVVTWVDYDGTSTDHKIYQRVFDAEGVAAVGDVLIASNLTFLPEQKVTEVAGGWVVVWTEFDGSDGTEVQQQAFGASGAPIGGEGAVNTQETGTQHYTAVAAVGSGWVVTWLSANGPATILDQRYDDQAVRIGAEQGVSTLEVGQFGPPPAITAIKGGGWVVAWESVASLNSGDVLFQMFKSDGSKLDTNQTANTTVAGSQDEVRLAAFDGGGFIVAWASFGQDAAGGTGVYFQRFDAGGGKVGSETRANTTTAGNQDQPLVTVLSNDGWVVTWRSGGKVFQQAYEADGDPIGSEREVVGVYNTMTEPAVAALSDGRWVVAAAGGGKIWQQVFNADGTSTGEATMTVSGTTDTRTMSQPRITVIDADSWVVTWEAEAIVAGKYSEDILQRVYSITPAPPPNHAPTGITAGSLKVQEGKANGSVAGSFSAVDADAGDSHTFSLTDNAGGRFSIDAKTAQLKVADGLKLDFEQSASHTVKVRVSDGKAAFEKTFTVTVIDVASEDLAGSGKRDTLLGGNGIDKFRGMDDVDTLDGGGGDDSLDGGDGNDTMRGKGGNDTYIVGQSGDVVDETGGNGTDLVRAAISFSLANTARVKGSVENLTLTGAAAINAIGNGLANKLVGNAGANLIDGGAGNDTATGGGGADSFVFASALNASTNVDHITDFASGQDKLRLDASFFAGLKLGALSKKAFLAKKGADKAKDKSDRVIYDTKSGEVHFDKDGKGKTKAVLVAVLDGGPDLTHTDVLVVA